MRQEIRNMRQEKAKNVSRVRCHMSGGFTQHHSNGAGFSLIELLVVIGITATLVAVALPNFVGARERARDVKRKSEMAEFRNALRLYYNDYQKYPADSGGPMYTTVKGCKADGATTCPCSSALDFAAGGAGCDVTYMKKFPSEFGAGGMYYYQVDNGNDFRLTKTLENASDPDIATSQARCPSVGSANCTGVTYCLCAD